jgi:transposase
MIANLLEGMEPEEAGRLCGLSRTAAYEWHNRYEEEWHRQVSREQAWSEPG